MQSCKVAMGVLEKNLAKWQSGKRIFETSFATGKVAKWQTCKVAMGVLAKVCQMVAKWQSGNATILANADLWQKPLTQST